MSISTLALQTFPDAAVVGMANHERLAELATQALIAEAELTPKPGLVDRRGSGAHCDLTLELMRTSAFALKPYFSTMAYCSFGQPVGISLRQDLASIGRDAERAMYEVTGGSNSHKGAIWILGLLVAAAARKPGQSAEQIARVAGAIARLSDSPQRSLVTHGEIVKIRYGVTGARGEACSNFPHVVKCGLPTLCRQRRAGFSEEVARLDALFKIMAQLDDTCVLYRGGIEALHGVKLGARAVLKAGACRTPQGRKQIRELDRDLTASNVSPGGSADLLAATIFLDAVGRGQPEICPDKSALADRDENESKWEEIYGAA